jgi:hypothetical protein
VAVDWPPEGLELRGDLYLQRANLSVVPENLKVSGTVNMLEANFAARSIFTAVNVARVCLGS